MKNIQNDINNNTLKHCYLLLGEEDYLKKQMKDNLSDAIIADDEMNKAVFKDKVSEQEVCDLALTVPFFAQKRLIVLDSCDFFSWASDGIANIIKDMPDYLYMIIVESSADKRKKVYKEIEKNGYVCELKKQSQGDLKTFIKSKCEQEGFAIEPAAVEKLIDATNGDLNNISNELQKLLAYCAYEKKITAADVDKVCAVSIENKIFEMIEAIGKKDNIKAIALYNDLIALKEPPIKILILLERQFMGIAQVKGSVNIDASQIGMKGVAPFVVKKYRAQADNFSQEALENLLKLFEDMEYKIKSGLISDRNGLEIIISKAMA